MSLPRADSAQRQPPQSLFEKASGVIGTRQGDTTVLLDVNGGTYYTLNEVGGRIWELLGTGLAVPAIIAQLQKEYDVGPETLKADTLALIDHLHKAKLVKATRR
jgi:hypothetical protein